MKIVVTFISLMLATGIASAQDLTPHPAPANIITASIESAASTPNTNSEASEALLLIAQYAPLYPPASAWQAFNLNWPHQALKSFNLTPFIYPSDWENYNWHPQYSRDLITWLDLPAWGPNMADGKTLSITTDEPVCYYRMIGILKTQ